MSFGPIVFILRLSLVGKALKVELGSGLGEENRYGLVEIFSHISCSGPSPGRLLYGWNLVGQLVYSF